MFADVYVGYPVDSGFTYGVPAGMDVSPGMRVRVDFRGRKIIAFVHRVHDSKPKDFKVKDIREVIDPEPVFDERLIELCRYVAINYISAPGEVLSLALPSGVRPSDRFKNPFEKKPQEQTTLSDSQKLVYSKIINSFSNDKFYHLIFGITGSGKTAIYTEVAKYLIAQGRSVIYLVPEISLSSQIFERLYNIFGDDLVVYHSHLTPNQRLSHWLKFYRGEATIAVGTRSAVFLQSPKLGMIIIDEEHDGSYKEHSSPRYNARRVAFYRCKTENALLLMGSATPSIESLYASERGIMELYHLTERYGNALLPEIEIVKVNPGKSSGIVSSLLKMHTKRAIDNGKQAIYLLNRRGFSPFVICNDCGEAIQCPHCNISMNYHKDGSLLCHYCGYKRNTPEKCEECGSEDIIKLGAGTQRVEEVVNDEFKDFRIFRLDQDSSRKKNATFDLIEQMKSGEIDILLGTQMVAKGFDFPGVVIVGVLLADIGLNLPDFRASERIFSLLVQVAGRSGRGEDRGKVILQSIDDEHEIFKFIKNHDYYGFYRYELSMRKTMGYPPFIRLARLLVRGQEEAKVVDAVNKLKTALELNIKKTGSPVLLLGPSEAPISKISNNYRHHIILKSKETEELRKIIVASKEAVASKQGLYLEIDMDPVDML
ncbi:MAG: primosomal protein N' [bacterium]|nr:primosomal protein N' [bacterium]